MFKVEFICLYFLIHEFKVKINNLLAMLTVLMQTLKGISNILYFVHTCISQLYSFWDLLFLYNTTFSIPFLCFSTYYRHWVLTTKKINQEME